MRLFVAITPDAAALAWIASEQSRLRTSLGRFEKEIRWLPPESIHLTLSFLGEIPDPLPVEEALGECRRVPIRLEWQGRGVFPGWRRPTVIWLALADPSGELARLHAEVTSAMSAFFEPENRRFTPHLSLARIKPHPRSALSSALKAVPEASSGAAWVTKGFCLMQSKLTPSGAQYSVVREFTTS